MKKTKQAKRPSLVKKSQEENQINLPPDEKRHVIFFQMHIKNLVSIMEVTAYDWSMMRLPTNYIHLEFIAPQEDADIIIQRLKISQADFHVSPHTSAGGNQGTRIILQNVLGAWVDSLRFWR